MKSVLIILGHFVKTSQMVQPHVSAGMDTRNKMANVLISMSAKRSRADVELESVEMEGVGFRATVPKAIDTMEQLVLIEMNAKTTDNRTVGMQLVLTPLGASSVSVRLGTSLMTLFHLARISTNVILTAVDATTCVPTQMGLISAVVARDIFSIAMVKPVEQRELKDLDVCAAL